MQVLYSQFQVLFKIVKLGFVKQSVLCYKRSMNFDFSSCNFISCFFFKILNIILGKWCSLPTVYLWSGGLYFKASLFHLLSDCPACCFEFPHRNQIQLGIQTAYSLCRRQGCVSPAVGLRRCNAYQQSEEDTCL